jgi:hypothetical protein
MSFSGEKPMLNKEQMWQGSLVNITHYRKISKPKKKGDYESH